MRKRLSVKMLGNEGFTLLEVLIAVVILALGLLAVAQIQVIAIRSNAQSRDVTEATAMATDHLEYLKTLPFGHADLGDLNTDNNDDLTGHDPDDADQVDDDYGFNPDDTPVGKYGRMWNVADAGDTKSVVVIVRWLSGPNRVPKEVQVPTTITDPNL